MIVMPEDDVHKDIERIENRIRTNFFEIEKRLTGLEEKIKHIETTGAPEEMDERLKELEDLILLVQAENLQIKQKLFGGVEVPETDIEKRVKKIEDFLRPENLVGIIKDVVREEGMKIKDLSEIRERLDSIEDKIKRYEKSLEGFRAPEMEKIKQDLEERIAKLEEMKSVVDQIKSDREIMENKFKEVLEEFERIQKKFSEGGFYHKIIKDLQESVDELKERLMSVERLSRELGSEKIADKLKEFKNDVNKLRDEIVKINSALTQIKIDEEGLKDKITKIPALEDEFYDLKKHIDKKVEHSIEKYIGSLNQLRSEIDAKVREFNVLEETLKRSLSEYDQDYTALKKRLDKGLLKIEGLEKIFEELGSVDLRIKALESSVHKFDDIERKIKKLNEELRLKTKYLEDEIQKAGLNSERVESLERAYTDVKNQLDGLESVVNDERRSVESIEKNVSGLMKDQEGMKRYVSEIKGKVSEFEMHLPKIAEMEDKMYLLNKLASLDENIDKANLALIKLQTEKEKIERLVANLEKVKGDVELESKTNLEKMRKYKEELKDLEDRIKSKVEEILVKYVGDLKKILSQIDEERIREKGMLEAKMSQLELLEKDVKSRVESISGVKQELDKYKDKIVDELFSKIRMRIDKYFEDAQEKVSKEVREAIEKKLELEINRKLDVMGKRLDRVEKFVPVTGRYRPIKILLKEKKPEYWYEE